MNKGYSMVVAVIAIAALIIIAGSFYVNRKAAAPQDIVGGDKDANGCIGSAGYSWCEAKQKCLRPFEETCTSIAPKTVTFKCKDNKSIAASFYLTSDKAINDKTVDLVLNGGQKLSLPRAISGSGARYANESESFVFWNKGDTAFLTENGTTTFADCVLVK